MSEENGSTKKPDTEASDLECTDPELEEALLQGDDAYMKQHAAVRLQLEKARQQHLDLPPEPRVGVYICRCGGNISDVVDVERVAAAVSLIPGVVTAKVNTFCCSDPGQQTITSDILQENLDRVVVASCSPSLHEQTFRGAVSRANMNPYLYEQVNIREQGSWAHKHDPEGATLLAIRMIAAAVGKLRSTPLDQIKLPNHRKALVIGGGIAGMKAAVDMAGRGIRVLLVEKSERLGGRLNGRGRVYPTEKLASDFVAELVQKVQSSDTIELLLSSNVTSVNGFIGNFRTVIEGPFGPAGVASKMEATVGAIVMATGYRPYVPRDGEFLYRQDPCVLTTPEFIEFSQGVESKSKNLVYRGRTIRSIAFLHCVGSRQLDGINEPQPDGSLNTYCSRVCCSTILQQALAVRERFPQVRVYDFHRDIRTYGRGEEDYYINASKAGVVFFRYNGEDPIKVERSERTGNKKESPLTVTVKDALTWGEELTVPVDMVVLGVGMIPSQIQDLIESIKLSTGEDHFLQEVHPKLRPVEVAVNGVLLAGTAQGPMNIQETLNAAGAAAVKAASMFAKEMVELNPYVAVIDASRCDGEALCITQCDYEGALKMVEIEVDGRTVQRAEVNAGLCVGCGACVPVCPHRAIDVDGWRLDQYDAMVDGLVADTPRAPCVPELVHLG
jgi:heterodisulfide reductase subunit A